MAEYRVPSTKPPSFWNEETAIGAGAGSFIASFVGLPFIGMVAGAAIGGVVGRQREQKELTEGRVAKEPSLLNRRMLAGLSLGSLLGVPVGGITGFGLAGALAVGITILGGGAPILAVAVAGAVVGAFAGAVIGPVYGAVKGARDGKQGMQRDYAYGQQLAAQGLAPSPKIGRSAERAPSISQALSHSTPQAAASLAEPAPAPAMESPSFRARLDAERQAPVVSQGIG